MGRCFVRWMRGSSHRTNGAGAAPAFSATLRQALAVRKSEQPALGAMRPYLAISGRRALQRVDMWKRPPLSSRRLMRPLALALVWRIALSR
jgi:hypothetical protein